MSDESAAARTRALEQDEGLEILVDMLAVSQRFLFLVIACDTPRATREAFAFVRGRVEAERGEAVSVDWLDPYATREASLDEPFAPEALIATVLPRILRENAQDTSRPEILVLDGSRALPHDDRAWNLLFQRMNEQRNRIARTLPGPLVLCVHPRLERVFAAAAPDFWSICSFAAHVKGTPPHAPRTAFLQELLRTTPVVTDQWLRDWGWDGDYAELARDGDESLEHIHALNIQALQWLARGRPRHAMHSAESCLNLTRTSPDPPTRTGNECRRWLAWAWCLLGETVRAEAEIDACVEFARVESTRSDTVSDRHSLADCLYDRAQIGLLSQALTIARGAAMEAVQLTETALADGTEDPNLRASLAMYYECRGDAAYLSGDLADAATNYELAVQIELGLHDRFPRWGNLSWTVAETILRRGLVTWALNGAGAALDACAEGMQFLREILRRLPQHRDASHALVLHLGNLGDLHRDRGDPVLAEAAYEEALVRSRELCAGDPDNIFWRDMLAMSWIRWARFCEHERPERTYALSAWREARAIFEGLLAEAPARRDWAALLSECTKAIERVGADSQ